MKSGKGTWTRSRLKRVLIISGWLLYVAALLLPVRGPEGRLVFCAGILIAAVVLEER